MNVYNTDVKQKKATYEHNSFNLFQFLKLYRRQLIQFSFAAFAFITFGIGDGVTSAYMIHINGIMAEANPLVRSVVESHGLTGLIFFKMYTTFILLSIAVILEKRSKDSSYWMTNGFFTALAIGGVMATTANLMRVYGFEVLGFGMPSPAQLILVYLGLTFAFVTVGEFMDNVQKSKTLQHFMSTYNQYQVKENPTNFSGSESIVKNKPMLTNIMQSTIN
ncbi:MAG: hypothetical protein K0A90_08580 [Methanosarcinaceae archaeon]|nr:hypothetical protein [Methanosarcinaceae archaeon]